MSVPVIDPRRESTALRRVALLMERLRQDGHGDPELSALQSEVDVLSRAAAAGETVRRSRVLQLGKSLAGRGAPEGALRAQASTAELLRWSIFREMDEILRRLSLRHA